jgi:hypothetical protein
MLVFMQSSLYPLPLISSCIHSLISCISCTFPHCLAF